MKNTINRTREAPTTISQEFTVWGFEGTNHFFQVEDFSTLYSACVTQFRLILGDFDFPAIEKAHRFWGPIYFISYVFMVFFVLMVNNNFNIYLFLISSNAVVHFQNMFLAIINDTYSEVKEEIDNRREEFQVIERRKQIQRVSL